MGLIEVMDTLSEPWPSGMTTTRDTPDFDNVMCSNAILDNGQYLKCPSPLQTSSVSLGRCRQSKRLHTRLTALL